MKKEKLTLERVVNEIQMEVFYNAEIHSPHKQAKDVLINLLKQIRDEIVETEDYNYKTMEVLDKYLNEKGGK